MSKIEVDAITQQSGSTLTVGGGASKTVVADATTVTLGRCGGTVALASGATQTGFGRTGTVDWQTTPKTATFTAVSGEGYFANTTGSAFNMNLPAGVAGAIVSVADYAETFDSNNLTIVPNGTDKIGSLNENATLETKGQSVTLVFVDSTQGWINTMDSTSNVRGAPPFISATGGTITTSGNCKIHTFTGPGTFQVTAAGGPSNNKLAYMVVAGGGGSGGNGYHIQGGGGGGAGGFREGRCNPITPYTASPLVTTGITATVASFPITVGAGGGGGKGYGPSLPGSPTAGSGNNSTFSTITSAGGGYGGQPNSSPAPATYVQGADGGSGGGTGGGNSGAGGVGNTPPVSPAQGSNGGAGSTSSQTLGGSGGGATGTGSTAPGCSPPPSTPSRGAGATTHISASPVVYSNGGAYSHYNPSAFNPIGPASANTGDGADAQNAGPGPVVPQAASNYDGESGGSGIVIIRYKFQ